MSSVVLISAQIYALTPIARWDVVPYQRVDRSEVFNAGIVAFSKAGIDRITFTVSGQGYSGPNPQVSREMRYNPRTDVFEYWVPLNAANFSSDGVFTVAARIYGNDGDYRDLEPLSLVVDSSGNLPQPKAWVSNSGSNATGIIGNSSWPFATISGAVAAIQASNSGKADGGIVYLEEGIYELGNGSVSTSAEWLTISKASDADKDRTRIVNGGTVSNTGLLRFESVRIESKGRGDLYLASSPSLIWLDKCDIIGAGRHTAQSNPTFRSNGNQYVTDSFYFDMDYGMHYGILGRHVTMERIGNDPFVNVLCIIGAVVNDVDPGTTYWHADGYQAHTEPSENRIIYGYYGTNLHYQGLFLRGNGTHRNNAFINIFMEMRPPGRPGYAGGQAILSSGDIYGRWDHLLMWHCSFPAEDFSIYEEPGLGHSFVNVSFIGNLFREYVDYVTQGSDDPPYAAPGNSGSNEFRFNHFTWSAVDQGGGRSSDPHWFSKSPDSAVSPTQSVGDPMVNLADPNNTLFGTPYDNSPLVDRIPFSTVPTDALGNLRDSRPDIGALEANGLSGYKPLEPPTQIRVR